MANLDTTGTVRRGYLTLHRGGGFLSNLSSKRMWMVLCREGINGMGRPHIEMYRSEDNVSGYQPLRIIDLETVCSVQSVECKKGFLIELQDETMMLQCTSKADMEDWVQDVNRLRGGVDLASGQNSEVPAGQDLYESVPDDEVFRVRLRKSNTLRFSGPCNLEILRDLAQNLFHIALFTDQEPARLIVKWRIDYIRQYGSNDVAFKFQSGGKTPTGVDWFIVDTENGAAIRIHKSIDYWAKYIVDQIRTGRRQGMSSPVSRTPSLSPHSTSAEHTRPPTYAPLTITNRDQPSVYEVVNTSKRGKKSVQCSPATRPAPGSSVYQPLGINKDAPSTYETVNTKTQKSGGRQ